MTAKTWTPEEIAFFFLCLSPLPPKLDKSVVSPLFPFLSVFSHEQSPHASFPFVASFPFFPLAKRVDFFPRHLNLFFIRSVAGRIAFSRDSSLAECRFSPFAFFFFSFPPPFLLTGRKTVNSPLFPFPSVNNFPYSFPFPSEVSRVLFCFSFFL